MKNFLDSDYAANKKAEGIVYRFANETVEITLKDYLKANPDKTQADFEMLKALSDEDYLERDRNEYRQTWRSEPLHKLANSFTQVAPSPEDEIIECGEQDTLERQEHEQVKQVMQALDMLATIQRRRYLLHTARGLTTRQIAKREGVSHVAVVHSLKWAEIKIKKFLKYFYFDKKMTYQNR